MENDNLFSKFAKNIYHLFIPYMAKFNSPVDIITSDKVNENIEKSNIESYIKDNFGKNFYLKELSSDKNKSIYAVYRKKFSNTKVCKITIEKELTGYNIELSCRREDLFESLKKYFLTI